EMNRFITGNGGSCAVSTPTANDTPEIVLAALTAFIPPATPFVLTASATDPDGDVLAYSWEQFDSGFARPLIGPDAFDNGQGALFRVFPPTIEPRRYFPRMSDILAGTPTAGEMLPTFPGAERTFRAFVRDNNPLAGGVAVGSFATLTVPPGASPFAVTSPAPNARVPGGPATISWSVGGTNLAPISAASVVLELSADNGATWPTTLGTFTNNGTATISLPAGIVSNARVRVLVPGRIFFNISGRFRIGCPADYNDDNAADGDDVIAFFGLWDVSDPGADFNADGGVDGDDIIGFFGVWDGGC
ncbi:MAG: GC-type dockerin domain-anchored protein, partial [Phycisphaerales bacterium]